MTEQILKTNWKKLTREERGKVLYKSARIVQTPSGFWRVTSQTNPCKQFINVAVLKLLEVEEK